MLPPGRYRIEIAATGFGPYEQDGIRVDSDGAAPLERGVASQALQETVEVNAAGTGDGPFLDSSGRGHGAGEIGGGSAKRKELHGSSGTAGRRDSAEFQAIECGRDVGLHHALRHRAISIPAMFRSAVKGKLQMDLRSTAAPSKRTSTTSRAWCRIWIRSRNSAFSRAISTQSTETSAVGRSLVTTKTGTNDLHGSAFEFFRNTNFDATNYLARERAAYDRNQFGGTLGGHILRDRLFYFGDYQGTKMTQGVETGQIAVPSLAEPHRRSWGPGDTTDRQGQRRLSGISFKPAARTHDHHRRAILHGDMHRIQHRMCFSGRRDPGCCVVCAGAERCSHTFPSRTSEQTSSRHRSENQTLTDNKAALRLDWKTNAGDFSGYYFRDGYELNNPYPTSQGGANVPGFNAISRGRAQLANLGWTRTVGRIARERVALQLPERMQIRSASQWAVSVRRSLRRDS